LKLHQKVALAEQICRQSIAATKYAAALTWERKRALRRRRRRWSQDGRMRRLLRL
jgi:hypothetical protein